MQSVELYEEFAWLQGGPHLEVGFLTELKSSREEFLSKLLDLLGQTTPKTEIVSTATEVEKATKDFLTGYLWNETDNNSFVIHAWDALARFQFKENRESLIKMFQIFENVIHVNFYFWGDESDGWGHKGLTNEELPEFVDFLKSLGSLFQFEIGTIAFGAWALSLYPTDKPWGHADYALKNLTRAIIESRAHDVSHYHFNYVVARKDFLLDCNNLTEEDDYFILKTDGLFKRRVQSRPGRRDGV